jgi:hypothetical protein
MEPTIYAKLKDLSAGVGEGEARVSLSKDMADALAPHVVAKTEKSILDAIQGRPSLIAAKDLATLLKRAEKAAAAKTE